MSLRYVCVFVLSFFQEQIIQMSYVSPEWQVGVCMSAESTVIKWSKCNLLISKYESRYCLSHGKQSLELTRKDWEAEHVLLSATNLL